ncbi:hypothetical protein OLX02_13975 [Novosphingobium sp. KCTC 2891]|uniref:hypothetical protein n=1 Tax=Novosphingobium sp. KCTC 2891 TaxID=2989730 RepID=UPI0022237502|nr:hypothetical protein [Novosphingobium sp. KCTC 2891]MCW1383927.1 hypothetical protein [Novosphingobium sp. KCTC 2891]
MSGRGISKLGLPPMQYRVDIHLSDFETLKDAQEEDDFRSEDLDETTEDIFDGDPPYDEAMSSYLWGAAQGDEVRATLASATYMRELRINISGAIWRLIEESEGSKVAAFTIIPPAWEYSEDIIFDSDNIRGEVLLKNLRFTLDSLGAAQAKGWIIAFIHGEHEPVSGVFRLHVHGFACGEMIDVVDRLRQTSTYKASRWKSDGALNPVYRRVHITRKPLTDLPRAVTYALQSYWPARALLISEDGKRIRARRKTRIKEPYHSYALAYLHLHRIEDLTLMMGLRVTKGGLTQTKPVS